MLFFTFCLENSYLLHRGVLTSHLPKQSNTWRQEWQETDGEERKINTPANYRWQSFSDSRARFRTIPCKYAKENDRVCPSAYKYSSVKSNESSQKLLPIDARTQLRSSVSDLLSQCRTSKIPATGSIRRTKSSRIFSFFRFSVRRQNHRSIALANVCRGCSRICSGILIVRHRIFLIATNVVRPRIRPRRNIRKRWRRKASRPAVD